MDEHDTQMRGSVNVNDTTVSVQPEGMSINKGQEARHLLILAFIGLP